MAKVIFQLAAISLLACSAYVSAERTKGSRDAQWTLESQGPFPEAMQTEKNVAREAASSSVSWSFATVILAVPIAALFIIITAVLAVHTKRGWEVMNGLGLADCDFTGKPPVDGGLMASLVWQAAQVLDQWLPLANGKPSVSLRDFEDSVEILPFHGEDDDDDNDDDIDDFNPSADFDRLVESQHNASLSTPCSWNMASPVDMASGIADADPSDWCAFSSQQPIECDEPAESPAPVQAAAKPEQLLDSLDGLQVDPTEAGPVAQLIDDSFNSAEQTDLASTSLEGFCQDAPQEPPQAAALDLDFDLAPQAPPQAAALDLDFDLMEDSPEAAEAAPPQQEAPAEQIAANFSLDNEDDLL